jgi:hypothetical protein
MHAFRGDTGVFLNSIARKNAAFRASVRTVAARVGAKRANLNGTPMSAFKGQYASAFSRVRAGSIEVLTDGRHRFVVLNMDHVLVLTSNAGKRLKVADVFASLPTVPASIPRLRATSIAAASPYRWRDGTPRP